MFAAYSGEGGGPTVMEQDLAAENVLGPVPGPVPVPVVSGPDDWSRSRSWSFLVPMIGPYLV